MTKWIWYFGWLIAWLLLPWTFLFVPLANRFIEGGAVRGALRWLILMLGIALLLVGFRVIHKWLLARAGDGIDRSNVGIGSQGAGMSEREAALVAEARQSAFGSMSAAAMPADSAQVGAPSPTAIPSATNATPDFGRVNTDQAAATGVMKAAGNPLVRKAFAQAMKEVETETYDRGLWAMALVECNGDERAARIAYMRARAADLTWANARDADTGRR